MQLSCQRWRGQRTPPEEVAPGLGQVDNNNRRREQQHPVLESATAPSTNTSPPSPGEVALHQGLDAESCVKQPATRGRERGGEGQWRSSGLEDPGRDDPLAATRGSRQGGVQWTSGGPAGMTPTTAADDDHCSTRRGRASVCPEGKTPKLGPHGPCIAYASKAAAKVSRMSLSTCWTPAGLRLAIPLTAQFERHGQPQPRSYRGMCECKHWKFNVG